MNRVSPALVISIFALVLACTAGATAASSLITGKQIKNSSITSADIKNQSLTGDDIKAAAIGPAKLSDELAAGIKAGKSKVPGPAGPAGALGPAGPAGPAEPAASLGVVTVTSPIQHIPSGGYSTSMTATCPAGTSVIGTGFNTGLGNVDFVLSYGSFVGGFIDNDVNITIDAYVQAICSSGVASNAGARAYVPGTKTAHQRFAADERAARSRHH